MQNQPRDQHCYYKGHCDIADEVGIEHPDNQTGRGPVHFPDGYLLGPPADDKGHEDNQPEVGYKEAQESKYQH